MPSFSSVFSPCCLLTQGFRIDVTQFIKTKRHFQAIYTQQQFPISTTFFPDLRPCSFSRKYAMPKEITREDNIKMDLREVGWGGHGLDQSGSR
jgi:hypothetical protein